MFILITFFFCIGFNSNHLAGSDNLEKKEYSQYWQFFKKKAWSYFKIDFWDSYAKITNYILYYSNPGGSILVSVAILSIFKPQVSVWQIQQLKAMGRWSPQSQGGMTQPPRRCASKPNPLPSYQKSPGFKY